MHCPAAFGGTATPTRTNPPPRMARVVWRTKSRRVTAPESSGGRGGFGFCSFVFIELVTVPLVSVQRIPGRCRALRGDIGLADATFMATFITAAPLVTRGPNGPPLQRVLWHGLCYLRHDHRASGMTDCDRSPGRRPFPPSRERERAVGRAMGKRFRGGLIARGGSFLGTGSNKAAAGRGLPARRSHAGAKRSDPRPREASWSAVVLDRVASILPIAHLPPFAPLHPKAPEDWRTPQAGAERHDPGPRAASGSAVRRARDGAGRRTETVRAPVIRHRHYGPTPR